MTIVLVAQSVGALGALPDVAQAQDTFETSTQAEQNDYRSADERIDSVADSRAVEPGDSLWSIAHQRLGPEATPQQVAEETERIYELNRERIGDDPNLILVGQELLVSPVVGEEPRVYEPTIAEEGSATTPAAEQPVGEESAEANTEEPVAAPAEKLAEEPAEEPAAEEPVEEESAEANTEEPKGAGAGETRSMIGWALLLLTLLVVALGAWWLLISYPVRRGRGSRYGRRGVRRRRAGRGRIR